MKYAFVILSMLAFALISSTALAQFDPFDLPPPPPPAAPSASSEACPAGKTGVDCKFDMPRPPRRPPSHYHDDYEELQEELREVKEELREVKENAEAAYEKGRVHGLERVNDLLASTVMLLAGLLFATLVLFFGFLYKRRTEVQVAPAKTNGVLRTEDGKLIPKRDAEGRVVLSEGGKPMPKFPEDEDEA